MEQLEKVVKGLELTKSNPVEGWDYRGEGFDGAMVHTSTALIDAALVLIRQQQARIAELEAAQTARVLTLEEMQQWEIKTIWDKNAVYVENVSDPGYLSVYDGRDFDVNLDGYGISWRCWTQRPTDEQREAVKWDD